MKMVFIDTKNNIENVDIDYNKIYQKIGGWPEIVNPRGLPGYCLIVDEEGLLKNKDFNLCGSAWYSYFEHGQPIVGNILVSKLSSEGDFVSLSSDDCDIVIENANIILNDFVKKN